MFRPAWVYLSCIYVINFLFSASFYHNEHIILLKQTHLFLVEFLEYLPLFLDNNVDEESE